MKIATMWLGFVLAACGPGDAGPERHDASGTGERVFLQPDEIRTVELQDSDFRNLGVGIVDWYRITVDEMGTANKESHDGVEGDYYATVTPEHWARVCELVGKIPFSENNDGVALSGSGASLLVTTVDHAIFTADGTDTGGPSPLSELEFALRGLDGLVSWKRQEIPVPPRETSDTIIAVEFREWWDSHTKSDYKVRLGADGEIWKNDQRERGDHERGVFEGSVRPKDAQQLLRFLMNSETFAADAGYASAGFHNVVRSLEIERADGRVQVVRGEGPNIPFEIVVALEAIKGIDSETTWRPVR